jgi:hypothetical protein
VGSNQFVYYDAEEPSRCLAPDAYVQRVPPTGLIRSWKSWERGAPEVAVEIVSDSDARDLPWEQKLHRYRQLGVTELVRFDPTGRDPVLRIWDRADWTLVERVVNGASAPSLVLGFAWIVAPAEGMPVALRIAKDGALVPTRRERSDAAEAHAKAEQEALRAEQEARKLAESRIKELEDLLRRQNR